MGRAALVVLVFGAGCLRQNPAYDETEGGSEGASGAIGATTGDGGASGAATTDGGSGGAGESTGGTTGGATTGSTGEASTGESTGEASTGGAFCEPTLQGENICSPLGQTGLLLCETITTWDAARQACEQMCGRLAIVREAERPLVFAALELTMTAQDVADEQAIGMGMGSAVTNQRAAVWIGASSEGLDGPYTWLDGSVMPAAKDMFGWGPNDPDYSGLCAVIGVFGKGVDDGEYFDRQCDAEPYRYLCDPG